MIINRTVTNHDDLLKVFDNLLSEAASIVKALEVN